VNVTVAHEWEDYAENNNYTISIWIDPDVKVKLITPVLPLVTEGQTVKLKVNVTSNVEPGKGSGILSVLDNRTDRVLFREDIVLEPTKVYEVEFKAPENPTMFWIVRQPSADHVIWVRFAGWDLYPENNYDSGKLTVVSWQFIWVIIGIIIFIIIIAVIIRVITHVAFDVVQERRRFVKKKTGYAEPSPMTFIHRIGDSSEDAKNRFVKKKR